MKYDNLSDSEIDTLLKAKVAANSSIGPTTPATQGAGFTAFDAAGSQPGSDNQMQSEPDIDREWRFSEFNASVGGAMAGGTIGMMFGGPPGALVGGALGAEGTRRAALAGNEFLDWLDNKEGAQILPDSIQTMANEAMTSASMIYADMALSGLGSNIGKGFQKFKELFKGKYSEVGKLAPSELKSLLDKINVRGNPTLFGGPGSKRIAVALSKLPTSSKIMQESINTTFDDLVKHSDDLSNSIYSGGLSKTSAGKRIMEGLDAWSSGVKKNIDDLYNNIKGIDKAEYIDLPRTREALAKMRPTDLEKSSGSVFPPELKKYLSDIEAEKVERGVINIATDDLSATTPKSSEFDYGSMKFKNTGESSDIYGRYLDADSAKKLGAIERDFSDATMIAPGRAEVIIKELQKPSGKLKWRDASNMRSAIGSKLSAPPMLRMGDKPTGQYSNVYAALTEDLDNYALSKGGSTAAQVKRARNYVKAFHKRKALVDMIADSDTGEAAFNAALTGSKDGPTRINALRKAIRSVKGDEPGDILSLADRTKINGDDIWDEFVATNFWKFGRKPAGQQASVEASDFGINTFMKNYSNLKQSGSLDAMFATPKLSKVKPELERFVNVLKEVKNLDDIINFSRTAEQSAAMKMIAGGFGAAPGYAMMGPTGLVIGPLATMGGPYAMSRWMTSKAGLRFLTTSVKEASKIPNTLPQHLMRHFGRSLTKRLSDMVKKDPSMEEPAKAYLIELEKINAM